MTDLPGGELFDRYGLKRCRGCGRWRNPSSCCIPCVTRLARRMVERENTPHHEREGGRMSEKRQCAALVYVGGFHRTDCRIPAKHEEDGEWWCGVHAPSRARAKAEKRRAKWEAESAQRRAEWDREAALAAATEALVQAALAWASPQSATELAPLATHLKDAVAAYRKAKGEG